MSSVGGVDHEHGHDARERLRTRSACGCWRAASGARHDRPAQRALDARHRRARSDTAQPPSQADGHATSLAGVGAMVLTADCLPVALGGDGAVAMVHAGWRGSRRACSRRACARCGSCGGEEVMRRDHRSRRGPCCYEVGPEVHAAFGGAHRARARASICGRRSRPPAAAGVERGTGTRRPARAVDGAGFDLRTSARASTPRGIARRHVAACTIAMSASLAPSRRRSRRAGPRRSARWLSRSQIDLERMRGNLDELREQIVDAARRPAATRARSRCWPRPSTCSARICRCSPLPASGSWARTARRICRRRSPRTASCSRGTSSARCSRGVCARSCRTCA